jgi:hypothetical protein
MRVEELQSMSEADLLRKADDIFRRTETEIASMLDKPGLYAEARFYLEEIENRRNDKISRRDFRMELIVIALIALELVAAVVLAILGANQQSKDVKQQLKAFSDMQVVLSHMQDTSKATADTMAALKTTTETMASSLQKQVALFYDVSISITYNQEKKRLTFVNLGRTNVVLWGLKFFDESPVLETSGRTVQANGGAYEIDIAEKYATAVARLRKGETGLAPFEVYIKNERGEEFVQYCYFGLSWDNDVLKLATQVSSIVPEKWSRTKVTRKDVGKVPLTSR